MNNEFRGFNKFINAVFPLKIMFLDETYKSFNEVFLCSQNAYRLNSFFSILSPYEKVPQLIIH